LIERKRNENEMKAYDQLYYMNLHWLKKKGGKKKEQKRKKGDMKKRRGKKPEN